MREKPSVEYAEAYLRTPGVRVGLYLCFFGMQVFTPTIFDCLEYHIQHNIRERGEFQLTTAQDLLRSQERYIAFEADGERYDMGVPFGLAETQIALALNSPMRDRMLTSIVRIIGRGGQMVGEWM
jgi:UTP--glucose-1-phosphate uridylyltransferase